MQEDKLDTVQETEKLVNEKKEKKNSKGRKIVGRLTGERKMFTKLKEMHFELEKMKDKAEESGQPNLASAMAGACISLRAAYGLALKEGEGVGTQESNRSYASAKEARGLEIQKKKHEQRNLLGKKGKYGHLSNETIKDLIEDLFD